LDRMIKLPGFVCGGSYSCSWPGSARGAVSLGADSAAEVVAFSAGSGACSAAPGILSLLVLALSLNMFCLLALTDRAFCMSWLQPLTDVVQFSSMNCCGDTEVPDRFVARSCVTSSGEVGMSTSTLSSSLSNRLTMLGSSAWGEVYPEDGVSGGVGAMGRGLCSSPRSSGSAPPSVGIPSGSIMMILPLETTPDQPSLPFHVIPSKSGNGLAVQAAGVAPPLSTHLQPLCLGFHLATGSGAGGWLGAGVGGGVSLWGMGSCSWSRFPGSCTVLEPGRLGRNVTSSGREGLPLCVAELLGWHSSLPACEDTSDKLTLVQAGQFGPLCSVVQVCTVRHASQPALSSGGGDGAGVGDLGGGEVGAGRLGAQDSTVASLSSITAPAGDSRGSPAPNDPSPRVWEGPGSSLPMSPAWGMTRGGSTWSSSRGAGPVP